MIAWLKGELLEKQAPSLLLNVNGVGYELEAPMTKKAYTKGYYLVNQSKNTPIKWHVSWGASIPKNNGKAKALGQRVVHRLCEQGKILFRRK